MITPSPTSKSRTRLLLIAGAVAVLAIALFAGVFAYTRDDDSGSATDAEVHALYDRMLAAMTRPGMVLHVTDAGRSCGRVESWIDADEEVIRRDQYTCLDAVTADTRTISRDGEYWQVSASGLASSGIPFFECTSTVHEAIEFFLPCSWLRDEPVGLTIREDARFEGEAAVEIRARGEYTGFAYKPGDESEEGGVDTRVEFDDRLYLAVATGLPIALLKSSREDGGDAKEQKTLYETDFVERSSLTPDYFKPSGIGYVRDVFPDLGPVSVRDLLIDDLAVGTPNP